jgi:hypothetical protein
MWKIIFHFVPGGTHIIMVASEKSLEAAAHCRFRLLVMIGSNRATGVVYTLPLKVLNPTAESFFTGGPQVELSTGFQHRVQHAVAITAAAGQQESAVAVGGIGQHDDLTGHVAKGALQQTRGLLCRIQKIQVGQLFSNGKCVGAEQGQENGGLGDIRIS